VPSVLIKQEKIPTAITGAEAYKVHYRSHDFSGRPTESTGLVIAPTAPGENRKVMTWGHGTTGMGDAACPSAQPDPARELDLYFASGSQTIIDYGVPGLQKFIDEGYVVTATDYQGMGTPGAHQYTVNRTNALMPTPRPKPTRKRLAHKTWTLAVAKLWPKLKPFAA
jgi:hypothetical protein